VREPKDAAVRRRIDETRARVARAKALRIAGRYADAQPEATRSVDDARAIGYAPVEAETLLELASLELARDDVGASRQLFEQALEAAERGRDDRVRFDAARELVAVVGYRQHDYTEAHRYARLATAILERLGDEGGEPAAALAQAVGVLDYAEDKLDDAERELGRALAIREQLRPPDPNALAMNLTNLGNVAEVHGQHDRAIALHRRAATLFESTFGPHHPLLAQTMSNLAVAQHGGHHDRDSLASSERAVAIYEAAVEPGHRGLTISLTNLGDAYRRLGDPQEAEAVYERALSYARKGDQQQEEIVEFNLAQAEAALGHFARALELAQHSLELRKKVLGPNDVSTGLAACLVAVELVNLKRPDEAERYLVESKEIIARARGTEFSIVSETLGDVRLLQKRPADALKEYEHARALRGAAKEADDVGAVPSLLGIGRASLELRQPERALETLERAYELLGGSDIPEIDRAAVMFPLARALWETGSDRSRARKLAADALAAFTRSPANRDDAAQARAWLASRTSMLHSE
jgi:tetratricopeptide (TPR) repeat protein